MADRTRKVPGNVPGPFYCDLSCIDCGYCRSLAPGNFRRHEKEAKSFVFRQPEGEEALQECQDAAIGCPAGAIGEDGEGVGESPL